MIQLELPVRACRTDGAQFSSGGLGIRNGFRWLDASAEPLEETTDALRVDTAGLPQGPQGLTGAFHGAVERRLRRQNGQRRAGVLQLHPRRLEDSAGQLDHVHLWNKAQSERLE